MSDGAIVGAALVAHVPPLVLPLDVRLEMNEGRDFTIVDGLHRLRREQLDRVRADTFLVIDTHWFTTFEHVISAHARRSGRFTSEELPRGNPQMPYDIVGDPELAHLVAAVAGERSDTWVHATDDAHIAIHYPTVYLTPFLQGGEPWVTTGVCQTADRDDFLVYGEVIAEAVRRSGRRVVIIASGGLSHRFWPLRRIRDHEGADPRHIITAEARAADERVISLLEAGDHGTVIDEYQQFRQHAPEGKFAHYLTMVGALGGSACDWRGVRYSEYESAAGTGQVHFWFAPSPNMP
jgi:3,4-dihydroxyphenylacetate 2,3-dioxygenase